MTNVIPDVASKAMFPIGKAASILGIDRGMLRIRCEAGDIRCTYDPLTHKRFFSGEEIKTYWRRRMGIVNG